MVRWEVHDANKIIREELNGKLGNWIDVILGAKAGLLPFVVVEWGEKQGLKISKFTGILILMCENETMFDVLK